MKTFLRTGLLVLTCLFILPSAAQAAQAQVVDYTIYLNEIRALDNASTEYPYLNYKGVTYFPMTWYNCRFLGLTNTFTSENGLSITQTNKVTSSLGYYPRAFPNPNQVTVTIPTFPITVNGEKIDNSREPYPLLLFRDVTYFPLTWRFAHEAFGWSYDFGLKEDKPTLSLSSTNPHVQYFPALPGRIQKTPLALMDQGYYYYYTDDLEIHRAPLNHAGSDQKIYTFKSPPVTFDFLVLDEKPYLRYQQTADQSPQLVAIAADGSCSLVDLDLSLYTNGSRLGNRLGEATYHLQKGRLYRQMGNSPAQVCSQHQAGWFGIVKDKIVYTKPSNDGKIGYLYQVSGSGQDILMIPEPVVQVRLLEGYLICRLATGEDYGLKVINPDGSLCLALTDAVDQVSLHDRMLLLVTNVPEQAQDVIKVIALPDEP